MNTYKVLKDWGDFKEGEVFAPDSTSISQVDIDQLVSDGVLEAVLPEQSETDLAAAQRLELATKATASGVEFTDETTNDELAALIAAKEEKAPADEAEAAPEAEATAEQPTAYKGQKVISDAPRDINGITYHHIRLEDGTEYDLTDYDYETEVI